MDMNPFPSLQPPGQAADPTRQASQVVSDPLQKYRAWMAQYPTQRQNMQDALDAMSNAPPPTLQGQIDNLAKGLSSGSIATNPGLTDYSQGTTVNYQGTDPGVLGGNISAALSAAQNTANPNGVLPYIDTIGAIPRDQWNSLLNFQAPNTNYDPIGDLNTQRDKQTSLVQDTLKKNQSQQSAYATQLGGGNPGGIIPAGGTDNMFSAFGSLDGGAAGAKTDTGGMDTNFAPWNSLSYNPNGLGALGGYNSNPWNTAGPSNRAQSSWGGVYSNRNPFSLTG